MVINFVNNASEMSNESNDFFFSFFFFQIDATVKIGSEIIKWEYIFSQNQFK